MCCCCTQSLAIGVELHRVERKPSREAVAREQSFMHRQIPTTLFDIVVQYNASVDALCARLGVPRSDAQWLRSVSSPQTTVSCASAQRARDRKMGKSTPQSVLDATHTPLQSARFEHMFCSASPQHASFAALLSQRLRELRAQRREPPPAPSSSSSSSAARVSETRECAQNGCEKARAGCGFSRRVHEHMSVVSDGRGVMKTGRGLYRSTKSARCVRAGDADVYYFETVVVDDCGAGGVCVGVSSDTLRAESMLGSDGVSCGLHSSGMLVRGDGAFEAMAERPFARGDRVGVLIGCEGRTGGEVRLTFLVNGTVVGACGMTAVGGDDRLWATVCLLRERSKVVLLCCRRDWGVEPAQLRALLRDQGGGGGEHDGEVRCICCAAEGDEC